MASANHLSHSRQIRLTDTQSICHYGLAQGGAGGRCHQLSVSFPRVPLRLPGGVRSCHSGRMDHMPRDDDALIAKLRSRAHDPAWRFDEARIPRAWVEEHYGAEHARKCRHQGYDPRTGTQYLYYPAGAPEAVGYHRDSPRGPLFPRLLPLR